MLSGSATTSNTLIETGPVHIRFLDSFPWENVKKSHDKFLDPPPNFLDLHASSFHQDTRNSRSVAFRVILPKDRHQRSKLAVHWATLGDPTYPVIGTKCHMGTNVPSCSSVLFVPTSLSCFCFYGITLICELLHMLPSASGCVGPLFLIYKPTQASRNPSDVCGYDANICWMRLQWNTRQL